MSEACSPPLPSRMHALDAFLAKATPSCPAPVLRHPPPPYPGKVSERERWTSEQEEALASSPPAPRRRSTASPPFLPAYSDPLVAENTKRIESTSYTSSVQTSHTSSRKSSQKSKGSSGARSRSSAISSMTISDKHSDFGSNKSPTSASHSSRDTKICNLDSDIQQDIRALSRGGSRHRRESRLRQDDLLSPPSSSKGDEQEDADIELYQTLLDIQSHELLKTISHSKQQKQEEDQEDQEDQKQQPVLRHKGRNGSSHNTSPVEHRASSSSWATLSSSSATLNSLSSSNTLNHQAGPLSPERLSARHHPHSRQSVIMVEQTTNMDLEASPWKPLRTMPIPPSRDTHFIPASDGSAPSPHKLSLQTRPPPPMTVPAVPPTQQVLRRTHPVSHPAMRQARVTSQYSRPASIVWPATAGSNTNAVSHRTNGLSAHALNTFASSQARTISSSSPTHLPFSNIEMSPQRLYVAAPPKHMAGETFSVWVQPTPISLYLEITGSFMAQCRENSIALLSPTRHRLAWEVRYIDISGFGYDPIQQAVSIEVGPVNQSCCGVYWFKSAQAEAFFQALHRYISIR
eukprot:m.89172 g.89172  ORF g.89172 m.89172 type:complete len:574 (-) comp14568_c2_seq1:278-1999(-)